MKIGIIDADLIGRHRHRFPNLACEKISNFHKTKGDNVQLLLDYKWDESFDKIYISKVFTDTPIPEWIEGTEQVKMGGTGFYFDKAPDLPEEIEHQFPDYHLYDQWIESEVQKAEKEKGDNFNRNSFMLQFKEYTEYSIGFITRGCFRKCPFCVNQKYDRVFKHTDLNEFYDPSRKKICLLDDNFFGYSHWEDAIKPILATGKPFKFKQGMDERILNDKMCETVFNSKYDGDFTFAFDNISDYDDVHKKLKVIRKHTNNKNIKFYVLCGFENTNQNDIADTFKRIELLMKYQCLPYIMRYQDKNYCPWKESEYRKMYVTLARWCNQPSIFKKMSFRQFCEANQLRHKTKGTLCSSMKALRDFEEKYPEIAKQYFDLRYADFSIDEVMK